MALRDELMTIQGERIRELRSTYGDELTFARLQHEFPPSFDGNDWTYEHAVQNCHMCAEENVLTNVSEMSEDELDAHKQFHMAQWSGSVSLPEDVCRPCALLKIFVYLPSMEARFCVVCEAREESIRQREQAVKDHAAEIASIFRSVPK